MTLSFIIMFWLMKGRTLLLILLSLIFIQPPGFSQNSENEVSTVINVADTVKIANLLQDDTIGRPEIILSHDQAILLLQRNFLHQTNRAVPPDSVIKGDSVQYVVKPDTLFFPSRYNNLSDSIKAAVGVLLENLENRDSINLNFTGITNKEYQFWLNSKSEKVVRFWLKNDLDDSVTVWIGNPSKNTIGLYLEHGVSFRRPSMQGNVSEARINIEPTDKSKLLDIRKIITKVQYWKFRTEASFALNQGMVTNWVKGGENSVATALDITWFADYSNKPMLLSSSHFARLKYGLIKTGEDEVRKNIDLLETNSKLNHKAFGKFDFSAIMLFKTQLTKGYNYPNEVAVSKFMNPAIITIGFGLDYKPNKLTSINFSPLSYKATFVPDTANIDQTKYGVAADRRSKHEPGASFMITNEFRPVKNMVITNRLQLFTNYVKNPQNIDIDWEMIFQTNLNWFTDIRLNTHLIFDDDTRTPVFDKDKNPVMGNDGVQKKTARVQFKELLGLSFIFRF